MPLTHADLIKLSNLLGHKSIRGGLCKGFSMMLVQAFFAHDMTTFFDRLAVIKSYNKNLNKLKTDIDQARVNLKQRIDITSEQKKLLDIPAFFHGVDLYQNSYAYQEFFNKKYIAQAQIKRIYPLTQPLNTKTQLCILSDKGYALTLLELSDYVNDLEQIINETNSAIAIVIGSGSHAIYMHYQKEKQMWFYVNTNEFGFEHEECFYQELDNNKLTVHLFSSLSGSDINSHIVFNTTVISNQDSPSDKNKFQELECTLPEDAIRYNKEGVGLLYLACMHGQTQIVNQLLEQKDIDINKASSKGFTPLYVACCNGYLDIVKKLLQKNTINVNQADDEGRTPLFIACLNGHLDVVKELLDQKTIEIYSNPIMTLQEVAKYYNDQEKANLICLYLQIHYMKSYGQSLSSIDEEKSKKAIALAESLKVTLDQYCALSPEPLSSRTDFPCFVSNFKDLLHIEDLSMEKHRELWKPIVVNILIALTGIGLIAIALKASIDALASKNMSWSGSLFFAKTHTQQTRDEIEESLNQQYALSSTS